MGAVATTGRLLKAEVAVVCCNSQSDASQNCSQSAIECVEAVKRHAVRHRINCVQQPWLSGRSNWGVHCVGYRQPSGVRLGNDSNVLQQKRADESLTGIIGPMPRAEGALAGSTVVALAYSPPQAANPPPLKRDQEPSSTPAARTRCLESQGQREPLNWRRLTLKTRRSSILR